MEEKKMTNLKKFANGVSAIGFLVAVGGVTYHITGSSQSDTSLVVAAVGAALAFASQAIAGMLAE